ncbi:DUF4136 domain-containing protein [Croceibacterium aestuarii]|uniref:DUF4136 domain-containing protein n=1 Tax=Croceibacterium aestuarii TaxID=3064139 RepID=UPI00272E02E5|nr:DUF4136 domain-containing protein [Croceibacterium sp. D39]
MRRLLLAPFAALALAGCAQTVVSPVSVTRFIGNEPARLGEGSISVRAATDGNSLEFAAWKQAVAAELAKLGYRVVENEVSAQVAEVRVERARDLPEPRRGPVNVGVGGSTGSYGSGVGVGLGVDLSGPPPEVTDNRLRVVIKDNGTGQALWEGRAEFSASANSDYASAQAAANKMAAALFKGFPGESGTTIEVK